MKRLCGRNPWTAAILALILAVQLTLAWEFGRLGMGFWWLFLIAAWFVGAFANHTLYVIIHEATHNLIFRSRTWNQCLAIVADLPNTFPAAAGFRIYHLRHHADQGDYAYDADLASRWEARLIGNSILGKMAWQIFFPVFQLLRPPRLKAIRLWNRWIAANILGVALFDAALLFFCGPAALLYLAASFFFSVGFHPVGARWIQEHFTLDPEQETFSYYGPINRVALNVGFHNEHHDFPGIPWNRLPKLKAMAPEFYCTLKSHRSWTRLWLQFLLNPQYNLFSRVERAESAAKLPRPPHVRG